MYFECSLKKHTQTFRIMLPCSLELYNVFCLSHMLLISITSCILHMHSICIPIYAVNDVHF